MALLFGIPPDYNCGRSRCGFTCSQRQWSEDGRAFILDRLVQNILDSNRQCESPEQDELVKDILQTILGGNAPCDPQSVHEILQQLFGENESVQRMMQQFLASNSSCCGKSGPEMIQQLLENGSMPEFVKAFLQNETCGGQSVHDVLQQLFGRNCSSTSDQKTAEQAGPSTSKSGGANANENPIHNILQQLFGISSMPNQKPADQAVPSTSKTHCPEGNENPFQNFMQQLVGLSTSGQQTAEPAGPCASKKQCCNTNNTTVELAKMDVKGFDPVDVSVKVNGRMLKVSARHEEGSIGGETYVLKEFQQQLQVPEDVDPNQLSCEMTDSGVLSIKMPKKVVSRNVQVPISTEVTADNNVAREQQQQQLEGNVQGDVEGPSHNIEVKGQSQNVEMLATKE